MTEANKKYPNKQDYEPRGTRSKAGVVLTDELPLSDPSDSNTSDAFRKNQRSKTGENEPSAFNENKKDNGVKEQNANGQSDQSDQEQSSYSFNKDVHNKWNDQNPKDNPVRE